MRVTKSSRVRRSESEWREIFRKFEFSGLSLREFCRREDLVPSSAERWQRKLAVSSGERFVELASASTAPSESWELDVSLPNGVRLQFRG